MQHCLAPIKFFSYFNLSAHARLIFLKKSFQDSLEAIGPLTPSAIVQYLVRAFLEGPFSEAKRERQFNFRHFSSF
jgi:hypothetical protein